MKKQEIIKKLNLQNNFHLTLKVIQFTDLQLLKEFKNELENLGKSVIDITSIDTAYELLNKAYNDKIDYVLCNNSIDFLLPLVNVINTDDLSTIKPLVPVMFCLKDNKISQKLKTKCHQSYIPFEEYKSKKELINVLKEKLKLN